MWTDLIEAEDVEAATEQDVLGAEAVDAGALQATLGERVERRQVHRQHGRHHERQHVQAEQNHRRHRCLPNVTQIKSYINLNLCVHIISNQ